MTLQCRHFPLAHTGPVEGPQLHSTMAHGKVLLYQVPGMLVPDRIGRQ